MTKNREDIAVLKKALQFYSWTGTHPCIEKYILMIMIPFHIVGIIFYAKLYYYSLTRFNIHFIGIVLYFLNFLALILFNYICLKTTYSGAMLWNDLLKKIDDFDIKMKGQRNFNEETVCRYLLKNCVVFICYIAQYFVYILMNNVTDYQQIIGISYLCFIDIQIFVTTTTLVKFLNILVKRYDCFKTKIGDVYLTTQSDINFWSGKNLESSYLLLIDIIRKINKVYGGRIFVIVIKTFLYVLGCFQLLLSGHSRNGLQDIAILLHSVVQMFILLIFTVRIINGCDRIEEEYNDLLLECSHLRVELKNGSLRKDLQTVENYIRNLPPVFTAAGYFRLNQTLFSSLCSALVTYFIVIIQFNTVNIVFNNDNSTQSALEV